MKVVANFLIGLFVLSLVVYALKEVGKKWFIFSIICIIIIWLFFMLIKILNEGDIE